MRSIRLAALGIAVSICAQGAATPQITPFRTIALTDSRSIAEAISVNAVINRFMSAAGSCHAQSLEDALSCACAAAADLDRLRTVYRQTALRHPDWDRPNTIVSYRNPANGHFISLNFAAVSAMVGRCEKR